MHVENHATRIRRTLLIRLAKLCLENRLQADIDRLPIALYPRHGRAVRCCTHHDRAVTKYRLMAMLGHPIEAERDEFRPLHDYAAEAQRRRAPGDQVLTVIDEACSACIPGNTFITNACRGCVARPCTLACPRQAITIVDGQAHIDSATCVNCGKCQQVCPYHAIIYLPIPCEEACPAGAISKDADGREQIDQAACIQCGKCAAACPFGAIMELSQMVDVLTRLKRGEPLVAMLAPALAGHLPADLDRVATALLKLGFSEVVEVATGAEQTAREEAAEFAERIGGGDPLMTTSCCPAYVAAVKRHVPDLARFVSHTPSPMHFTARQIKAANPQATTVFIGPCTAKRQEAADDPLVDFVLTAEELGALFVAAEIEVAECAPYAFPPTAGADGRGFAISGGVTDAVRRRLDDRVPLTPMKIDGLTAKSLKLLKVYAKGKALTGNFLEAMGCEGGCVAGPCALAGTEAAARKVRAYAAAAPALPPPPDTEPAMLVTVSS